jgi:hypothetical protein
LYIRARVSPTSMVRHRHRLLHGTAHGLPLCLPIKHPRSPECLPVRVQDSVLESSRWESLCSSRVGTCGNPCAGNLGLLHPPCPCPCEARRQVCPYPHVRLCKLSFSLANAMRKIDETRLRGAGQLWEREQVGNPRLG